MCVFVAGTCTLLPLAAGSPSCPPPSYSLPHQLSVVKGANQKTHTRPGKNGDEWCFLPAGMNTLHQVFRAQRAGSSQHFWPIGPGAPVLWAMPRGQNESALIGNVISCEIYPIYPFSAVDPAASGTLPLAIFSAVLHHCQLLLL